MPNRILREGILTSERVDALQNWASEVFYRRLHSVVDDFGRYYANPSLLRAACYPLRLDKVSNADIGKWLSDCESAALVSTYEIDGKRFLQLRDFRQQRRAQVSKYPPPPSGCESGEAILRRICVADAQHPPASAHLDVGEGGVVDEGETLSGKPDPAPIREVAKGVLQFLNEKTGRAYQPVPANVDMIVARLKDGATEGQCRQVIAKKCREWGADEKMAEFLRPKTLFNRTNFAQYQGELVVPQ